MSVPGPSTSTPVKAGKQRRSPKLDTSAKIRRKLDILDAESITESVGSGSDEHYDSDFAFNIGDINEEIWLHIVIVKKYFQKSSKLSTI